MMKRLIKGISIVALFLLVAVSSAFALGTNLGFENNPVVAGDFLPVYAGDVTSISGWKVDSGSVDLIGYHWVSSEGSNNSIDLNGYERGSISQTIPTVIGKVYEVSFDLSGNPHSSYDNSPELKEMFVVATGASSTDYTYDVSMKQNSPVDMKWEKKMYSFTATEENTTLTFASKIDGAIGPAIDNVVISINEPSEEVVSGKVSGMKYEDLNRNGKKDVGEPGLQGWTIRLIPTKSSSPNKITVPEQHRILDFKITDINGNYEFNDVPPGEYFLRETHQKGWKRISKNPKVITITEGSDITDVDFGNAKKMKNEKEDTEADDNRIE